MNLQNRIEEILIFFEELEFYLIEVIKKDVFKKNLEIDTLDWNSWKVETLNNLEAFKIDNKDILDFKDVNYKIEELLEDEYVSGFNNQEKKIIKMLSNTNNEKKAVKVLKKVDGKDLKEKIKNISKDDYKFFKINDRKMNSLIKEYVAPINKAEKSILRNVDDIYRQIIIKAQLYQNTGVKTTYQAVDLASKDFLNNGISFIKYKDGKNVNIKSYVEMTLRTSSKNSYLKGQADILEELDIYTVVVNRNSTCSKTCIDWQGKVYIDDVYANGKSDGKYPLLSEAIAGGLYHPNCKHSHSLYIEGITKDFEEIDNKQALKNDKLLIQQRYNERNIRKYKRLKVGSLDDENIKKYDKKTKEWTNKNKELIKNNQDVLKRDYWREK